MNALDHTTKEFFAGKFDEHGESPEGVCYSNPKGQILRIGALVSQIEEQSGFSVADVGCGFGSLIEALFGAGKFNFDFTGYDLVDEMIENAKERWAGDPRLSFIGGGTKSLQPADYVLASGTFNMKQDTPHDEWHDYVMSCLSDMLAATNKKLIVNFLTSYSDEEYKRDDLFYANPNAMFDWAMQQTGSAAILHNYGLFDFTLVVNRYGPERRAK